jgi:hypothetical protein
MTDIWKQLMAWIKFRQLKLILFSDKFPRTRLKCSEFEGEYFIIII